MVLGRAAYPNMAGYSRVSCTIKFTTRLRRDDECMLNRVVLKSDYLRKAHASEQLNVEDLFHGGLEFQHCADAPAHQVHCRHTALELTPSLSQWHAVHR